MCRRVVCLLIFIHVYSHPNSSVECRQESAAASLASRGPWRVVLLRRLCFFAAFRMLAIPYVRCEYCGRMWRGKGGGAYHACARKCSYDCVCGHICFFSTERTIPDARVCQQRKSIPARYRVITMTVRVVQERNVSTTPAMSRCLSALKGRK